MTTTLLCLQALHENLAQHTNQSHWSRVTICLSCRPRAILEYYPEETTLQRQALPKRCPQQFGLEQTAPPRHSSSQLVPQQQPSCRKPLQRSTPHSSKGHSSAPFPLQPTWEWTLQPEKKLPVQHSSYADFKELFAEMQALMQATRQLRQELTALLPQPTGDEQQQQEESQPLEEPQPLMQQPSGSPPLLRNASREESINEDITIDRDDMEDRNGDNATSDLDETESSSIAMRKSDIAESLRLYAQLQSSQVRDTGAQQYTGAEPVVRLSGVLGDD
ncbi:hypothetical protein QOT17_007724 [Balamuthia mandrillaris]